MKCEFCTYVPDKKLFLGTVQDWTRPNKIRQDWTRSNKIGQDKLGQDWTRLDKTGQDWTRLTCNKLTQLDSIGMDDL